MTGIPLLLLDAEVSRVALWGLHLGRHRRKRVDDVRGADNLKRDLPPHTTVTSRSGPAAAATGQVIDQCHAPGAMIAGGPIGRGGGPLAAPPLAATKSTGATAGTASGAPKKQRGRRRLRPWRRLDRRGPSAIARAPPSAAH